MRQERIQFLCRGESSKRLTKMAKQVFSINSSDYSERKSV